jgi:hypothetical protein
MQNYENHAQRTPLFLVLCGVFAVAFFWQAYLLFQNPSVTQLMNTLVSLALAAVPFVLRIFTLRVQDRVIRLEMRLRLREVLPASMHADIHKIAPRHLVALRFAGNEELPALVTEVLANPDITPKAIKQKVKNWQADYLRA